MPTISRRLASAGTADPGDLKSPRLPGASPGSPTGVWFAGNSRPVRLKPEQPWECNSPHADQSGMSTGQARRACLLNSACLRASGASPRHSAGHNSRASAQVGFISPLSPGQHRRLRPFSPPCSSLRISFVRNSYRGGTGWRLPVSWFTGEWLSGNSRPRRSRVCEPWRCKLSLAHQFQGVEATADRHPAFTRTR